MTPSKAIRLYCKWCCNGYVPMKKYCGAEQCPLYDKHGRTVLKRIKLRCLDCSGFNINEVKNCKFTDCVLYIYRKGKNPKNVEAGKRRFNSNKNSPLRKYRFKG